MCEPPVTPASSCVDDLEDTPGNACSPFTANWYDADHNVLWSNLHIDTVVSNNGGLVGTGALDHVGYGCASTCVGPVVSCSYAAEDDPAAEITYTRWDTALEAETSYTMQRIALNVMGLGVRVQYTGDPSDSGGTGPLLVVVPGAGSDKALAAAMSIRKWFETRAGMDTAVVTFETGLPILEQVLGGETVYSGGWQSRSAAGEQPYPVRAEYVASVMDWINTNLRKPGQELATLGCSMGCLATIAGPVWFGQDFYDLQVFVGGPPMFDVNAGCGRMPERYALPVPWLLEERYGGIRLSTGTFCNDPTNASCVPYTAVESAAFVNHVHGGSTECLTSNLPADAPVAALDGSSLDYSGLTEWAQSHRIAFFANAADEGLAGPSFVRAMARLRDNHLADPSMVTYDGDWMTSTHCGAFTFEPDAHRVRDLMQEELTLGTSMFDLRVKKDGSTGHLFTATDACLSYAAGPPAVNDFHLGAVPTLVDGSYFELGPFVGAGGAQATIPTGTTIALPVDLGGDFVSVERLRLVTGGTREGAFPQRATYAVTFDYDGAPSSTVTVEVPRDDNVVHGDFSGPFWESTAFTGMTATGPATCGSGGDVITIFNPKGYDGPTVESITITYPGDTGTAPWLGGPLALTVFTDVGGYEVSPPAALTSATYVAP